MKQMRRSTAPESTAGIGAPEISRNEENALPHERFKPPLPRFAVCVSASVKKILLLAALLFCASTASAAEAHPREADGTPPNILIAYFSLSGNTRLIARDIQKMTGGDLFEIRPVHRYGPDFDTAVEQARQELAEHARPPLQEHVADITRYDVVFVGFPNWVGTMPMPVFTFLEQHDLSGKIIVPFCTHGTSGPSNTIQDLKSLNLHAEIRDHIAIYRNDVRDAEPRVRAWLDGLGYLKKEAS